MSAAASITVRVPLDIRHQPGRKTVVTPAQEGVLAMATRADPALVKALARAFRYQRLLDEGRYASISEMAVAEKIERGYLGTLLRLTLLAPDVVEAVLEGRQLVSLELPQLLEPFPIEWVAQREALANAKRRLPIDPAWVLLRASRIGPDQRHEACGHAQAAGSGARGTPAAGDRTAPSRHDL
jgi:hypothetical protein